MRHGRAQGMSRGRIVAASVAGFLWRCVCGSGAPPPPQGGPQAADAATAIAADEEQWNRDYAAHDVERLIAHYAPDATMKIPDTPPMSGTWIRSAFEASMHDPAFSMTFRH